MSDFLDIDYRMSGYPVSTADFDLDVRGRPSDPDDTLVLDLEQQMDMLKEERKRGNLNILPPTYKSGNPRAIQQGSFIRGEQVRGDKVNRFSGVVVDRGNLYGKRMNIFLTKNVKDYGEGEAVVKTIKRSYVKEITPPKTTRKQTKPERNKKTAPQKVARSELKTGGALAKAKAREELKTGKKAKKGKVSIVGSAGDVYRDEIDKVYLKRNIRA